MYPLILHAKPGSWRKFTARKADASFQSFQEKVWLRDNYTCQYCGFQAKEFQEVVNNDNDYNNNKLSNMVTACCFCAQCFFLESVAMGNLGGGTLIYLPEISQSELNSFCHVLFCAIANDTGYKMTAQSIYRSFKFRSQIVEEKFGEGASSPAIFGQLLIDSDMDSKQLSETVLKGICLLPARAKFKKQIEHWAASARGELAA